MTLPVHFFSLLSLSSPILSSLFSSSRKPPPHGRHSDKSLGIDAVTDSKEFLVTSYSSCCVFTSHGIFTGCRKVSRYPLGKYNKDSKCYYRRKLSLTKEIHVTDRVLGMPTGYVVSFKCNKHCHLVTIIYLLIENN